MAKYTIQFRVNKGRNDERLIDAVNLQWDEHFLTFLGAGGEAEYVMRRQDVITIERIEPAQ